MCSAAVTGRRLKIVKEQWENRTAEINRGSGILELHLDLKYTLLVELLSNGSKVNRVNCLHADHFWRCLRGYIRWVVCGRVLEGCWVGGAWLERRGADQSRSAHGQELQCQKILL